MSLFPRSNGSLNKIILPIRSNLKTYNEIPEHTIISTNTNIPSELDGETVVARYRNLTINPSCTLTPSLRCCGMVLVVDGDLLVGGKISMTARGASYQPITDHKVKSNLLSGNNIFYEIDIPASAEEITDFLKREKRRYHSFDELPAIYRPTFYAHPFNDNQQYITSDLCSIPAIGGAGGAGVPATTSRIDGNPGSDGTNRGCGGGGSGAAVYINAGNPGTGAGGAATCYSGGAASGGCYGVSAISEAAEGYGGAGGAGLGNRDYGSGGGAGNPAGAGTTSSGNAGGTGTGGLLVIICTGSITVAGSIEAKGSNGGYGYYAGGGGSGGGSINIFYGGQYINNGSVSVAGGAGGGSNQKSGGKGGDGCITIEKYNF